MQLMPSEYYTTYIMLKLVLYCIIVVVLILRGGTSVNVKETVLKEVSSAALVYFELACCHHCIIVL
jgi:hypothetical protein